MNRARLLPIDSHLCLSKDSACRVGWGLFDRRPRWSLTGRGWALLSFTVLGIGLLFFFRVHAFLAVTERVEADFLVVEGWVHDDIIRAAAAEFTNGHYHRVLTTGGPVRGAGPRIADYNTSASVAAGRLRAAGVPEAAVQMVPSYVRERDRTYTAALTLRDWFGRESIAVNRINVLTEGVHARRSRLLFQKAFGDSVNVGIIAIPDSEYPAQRWWKYSDGIKAVISEGAAYLYVRFFFHPDSSPANDPSPPE